MLTAVGALFLLLSATRGVLPYEDNNPEGQRLLPEDDQATALISLRPVRGLSTVVEESLSPPTPDATDQNDGEAEGERLLLERDGAASSSSGRGEHIVSGAQLHTDAPCAAISPPHAGSALAISAAPLPRRAPENSRRNNAEAAAAIPPPAEMYAERRARCCGSLLASHCRTVAVSTLATVCAAAGFWALASAPAGPAMAVSAAGTDTSLVRPVPADEVGGHSGGQLGVGVALTGKGGEFPFVAPQPGWQPGWRGAAVATTAPAMWSTTGSAVEASLSALPPASTSYPCPPVRTTPAGPDAMRVQPLNVLNAGGIGLESAFGRMFAVAFPKYRIKSFFELIAAKSLAVGEPTSYHTGEPSVATAQRAVERREAALGIHEPPWVSDSGAPPHPASGTITSTSRPKEQPHEVELEVNGNELLRQLPTELAGNPYRRFFESLPWLQDGGRSEPPARSYAEWERDIMPLWVAFSTVREEGELPLPSESRVPEDRAAGARPAPSILDFGVSRSISLSLAEHEFLEHRKPRGAGGRRSREAIRTGFVFSFFAMHFGLGTPGVGLVPVYGDTQQQGKIQNAHEQRQLLRQKRAPDHVRRLSAPSTTRFVSWLEHWYGANLKQPAQDVPFEQMPTGDMITMLQEPYELLLNDLKEAVGKEVDRLYPQFIGMLVDRLRFNSFAAAGLAACVLSAGAGAQDEAIMRKILRKVEIVGRQAYYYHEVSGDFGSFGPGAEWVRSGVGVAVHYLSAEEDTPFTNSAASTSSKPRPRAQQPQAAGGTRHSWVEEVPVAESRFAYGLRPAVLEGSGYEKRSSLRSPSSARSGDCLFERLFSRHRQFPDGSSTPRTPAGAALPAVRGDIEVAYAFSVSLYPEPPPQTADASAAAFDLLRETEGKEQEPLHHAFVVLKTPRNAEQFYLFDALELHGRNILQETELAPGAVEEVNEFGEPLAMAERASSVERGSSTSSAAKKNSPYLRSEPQLRLVSAKELRSLLCNRALLYVDETLPGEWMPTRKALTQFEVRECTQPESVLAEEDSASSESENAAGGGSAAVMAPVAVRAERTGNAKSFSLAQQQVGEKGGARHGEAKQPAGGAPYAADNRRTLRGGSSFADRRTGRNPLSALVKMSTSTRQLDANRVEAVLKWKSLWSKVVFRGVLSNTMARPGFGLVVLRGVYELPVGP